MTINFVGSTAADLGGTTQKFTIATRPTTGYGTNLYDTDYSSECAGVQTSQDIYTSGGFVINTPAHVGDFWCHWRTQFNSISNVSNLDGDWVEFYDASDNLLAHIQILNNEYYIQAHGDTVVDGAVAFAPTSYTPYIFDVKITVGANIVAEFYVNGTLMSTATAANTGGKTACVKSNFQHTDMYFGSSGTASWLMYSEVIVTDDESTIGWRVATLNPDSTGNSTDLIGDIAGLLEGSDGLTVSGATNGDKGSWTLSTYNGPTSPSGIRALVTKTKSQAGVTGPQNLQHFLRVGSTDYANGVDLTPDPSVGETVIWDNNPATSSPWATATLTGLEQGVEIKT